MLIIVNFKTYEQGTGMKAVKLAKICDKVAEKTGANIAVAVQPSDIFAVSEKINIPVLAQHVDPILYGAHTGSILPESIQSAGAVGSLINHSEKQLPLQVIKETINSLKKLNLLGIACAGSAKHEEQIAKFRPDVIAIEPPALIGGKISVCKAKPHLIEQSVKRAGRIPVLCGAGIHTKEDVKRAIELGAQGILVSSAVVKAKNPAKVLRELVL